MKIRGSDGSKTDPIRDVGVARLKGPEQQAVRGRTVDQVVTTISRVLRAREN